MGPTDNEFGMERSPQAVPTGVVAALAGTHPWARFLAILGFCVVGLMLFAGLAGGVAGAASGNPELAVIMVIYPLMSLIYFFPALFLLRFANRTRDFVARGEPDLLQAAVEAQRSLYKFTGIVAIIGILLSIGMIILVMTMGLAASGGIPGL
jgi:uncharacterized membrane protein YhaH (DUF805 family)